MIAIKLKTQGGYYEGEMAIVKKKAKSVAREPCTDRKERTKRLQRAAIMHFTRKGYCCWPEIGIQKWGARRADVLGFSYYERIIIGEVKSCPADLYTDKKLTTYLDHCHALYLVMASPDWKKVSARIRKGTFELDKRIGVLTLTDQGHLRSVRKAKTQEVDPAVFKDMLLRMLWRSAPHTKRNTRRLRIYL